MALNFKRNPRIEAIRGWFYRTLAMIKVRTPWAGDVRGLRIDCINQTCSAFPSQWEGWLTDGRPLYIRYRFGVLSVSIGQAGDTLNTVPGETDNYLEQVGHEWDGRMSLKDACRLTGLKADDALIDYVDQTGGNPVPVERTGRRQGS